jgi:uncharacterized protein (TIGR02444 family)
MARGNPFWRLSLRTWRAPGVQEACIALQDRCGADVNLLLFCGWTGRSGRELDQTSLFAAISRVGAWQSAVVAPLRAARRALKQQHAGGAAAALALPFRRRLAALEVDLERAEQRLLAELAAEWPPVTPSMPPRGAIVMNLERYLAVLGKVVDARDADLVARIADGCAPRGKGACVCAASRDKAVGAQAPTEPALSRFAPVSQNSLRARRPLRSNKLRQE